MIHTCSRGLETTVAYRPWLTACALRPVSKQAAFGGPERIRTRVENNGGP